MSPPTTDVYTSVMQKRGLKPEIVSLPHDTEGFWLGNKNAKNVVIYYHGTFSHIQHRASPCVTLATQLNLRTPTNLISNHVVQAAASQWQPFPRISSSGSTCYR